VLRLPDDRRDEFGDPMGPVYEDAEALLADAGRPVVAVGDVVTHHLLSAGHEPLVAVVDGRTERSAVSETVGRSIPDADVRVENPPAELTRDLLVALRDAVASGASTVVAVDGEEDLATLPAVLLAPDGATVVYGQPGEGMVHVDAGTARERARDLLRRLSGDVEGALALLDGRS